MSKGFLFALLTACFAMDTANAAGTLFVRRMVPEGKDVVQTDKIVFEFNMPVVPLGEMERARGDIPVEITPALACHWRWLNQSSLACLLEKDSRLVPATGYRIKFNTGLKALSGEEMRSAQTFTLETMRPEIDMERTRFIDFVTPQSPEWQVTFKTDVDLDSVRKNIGFEVNGKTVAAVVSPVRCEEYENDCASRVSVRPERDLGRHVAYQLVYRAGFKALNGGNLTSLGDGIAAAGKTLPDFQVTGIECYGANYDLQQVVIDDNKVNKPVCRVDSPVRILLSDKAVMENIADFVHVTPAADIGERPAVSATIDIFPKKAGTDYTVTVSDALTDVWGGKIKSAETLYFTAADKQPSLNLPYSSVMLESGEDTAAIGYATNLDKASADFTGFTAAGNVQGTQAFADILPAVRNITYPVEYGVRKMLGGQSGFVAAKVKADGVQNEQFFTASVAPWQVVAKIGRSDSMVWVADLKTGKPVSGAEVRLLTAPLAMPANRQTLESAKTDKTGRASLTGYRSFDPKTEALGQWNNEKPSLFIQVVKDGDTAVLPLNYSFALSAGQLSDWRISTVYAPQEDLYYRAFGFTTQGIYRAGDKADYKIYVRHAENGTLTPAPIDGYDLSVTDAADNVVFEQKGLSLSAFGSLNGQIVLPAQAVAGWYDVWVKRGDVRLNPTRFLVSDFNAAAFKSSTEVNGKVFKAGDDVKINSSAALYSGGAYAKAKMRQSAVLKYATFGIDTPKGEKAFSFTADLPESVYAEETLVDMNGVGDEKGVLNTTAVLPKSAKPYGKLRFETTVYDDSGRTVSSYASADYFAVDRLIGVRRVDEEAFAGKKTGIEYIVVGTDGKPVAGVPVTVKFTRSVNKLVREKSAGNAYLQKYTSVDEEAAECMGMSALKAQKCAFTPEKSGYYKATATINGVSASTGIYAYGADYSPWAGAEHKLNMTANRESYKIGDKIVLTVENPVPGAVAFVTVERDGVIKSFVQKMKKSLEKIELPVTDDYFPGVYVSVAAFSPRVAKKDGDGPDLGKPAQWTGYVKIPVLDASRQLTVEVKPEKTDYRPKEKVRATLSVKLPVKRKTAVEAAVIVVDEAVLSLLPKGAAQYNPYEGLNALSDLDVRTYSLIEDLIGRQKVEKKGANQGGDGGNGSAVMRDVFKHVAYFNPSVVLENNGKATIEAELPDNLTGWRIIAVAVSPDNLSGMGQARFNVSQPLEVRALLPNQVRAGDAFAAGVSVLNRTGKKADVTVLMKADGALKQALRDEKKITLAPYERQSVYFEAMTATLSPAEAKGKIDVAFKAIGKEDSDSVRKVVPVLNLTTMETAAVYGSAEAGETALPVVVPNGVKEFGGRLTVSVASGFMNATRQAIEALRDYPHPCWEQKLSRAVAAAVYLTNREKIAAEEIWGDAGEYIKNTLAQAGTYQQPDGGMSYFGLWSNPYLSAYTAYALDYLRPFGYTVSPDVEEKLTAYLTAFFNRSAEGVSSDEARTVRLLSANYLLRKGKISDADVNDFARSLPQFSAFDKALLLTMRPNNRAVLNDLINSAYLTSGATVFKDKSENAALLPSAAKTTCAALAALADTNRAESLMRGAFSLRRKNGEWENTHADAFCLIGLAKYAEKGTAVSADLRVSGTFDGIEILAAQLRDVDIKPVSAEVVLSPETAEKRLDVALNAAGTGRYYHETVLSYPSDGAKAVNAGMQVTRRFFVERTGGFEPVSSDTVLKRGDTVKVELTVTNAAAMSFVALRDVVAGALEPVNTLLATSSAFAGEKAESDFDYTDVGHAAVGFYADALPAGTHTVSYMAQVVAAGEFTAFPAKAEDMYTPDVFGLTAADKLTVAE